MYLSHRLGQRLGQIFLAPLLAVLLVAPLCAQAPNPPTLDQIIPEPGTTLRELYTVEIQFSRPVVGVDAEDLLVNGVPTTNRLEVAEGIFLFSFPAPAPGPVTISWRESHGIQGREDPLDPFVASPWAYELTATGPSHVLLSEFMADNRRTLNDEDGDSSDWIELFNADTEAVDLTGWSLTDDPTIPSRWRFPAVALPGRGYLVVFASGKDRTPTSGRLHTNFKLSASGGYLALLDADTNVVSEFVGYRSQTTDVAYGRVEGAPWNVGYFSKATPGAPNATSGLGFAPEVVFSRAGGTFTNTFALQLTAALAGASVRYTVDGSMPTESARLYEGAIAVTNTLQVRARAYAPGLLPGPVHSEGYVLLQPAVAAVKSTLPLLVLHAMGKGSPTASRATFAHYSFHEPKAGVARLTDAPTTIGRSALQIRGSSTEGYSKSSYKFELRDEFEQDLDVALLGLPAESDWVLYAPNNFDPVLIHNPFVHQLSRDLGRYSPRTRFVEVYLNRTTGALATTHYMGIYVLEEKIKIGNDRVDIDRLEPENLRVPEVTGGYLLKIDRLDPGDSGVSGGGVTLGLIDPKEREIKTGPRKPQMDYLRSYFSSFATALNGASWRDPVKGYPAFIDTQAWIDFHVLEVLSGNVDALVLSTYFHKPRNGRIVFGPHWDFDRALGSTDGRDANPRVWSTGPFFSAAWWSRLFQDKDFWQRWVDRWQELRQTQFSLAHINGLIDSLTNQIHEAQPREQTKWRVGLRRADGRSGGTYPTEVQWMKNWLSNRIDFIDRQLTPLPRLEAASGFVAPGFTLSLTVPTNATVYYTLDGTDPRASQGNPAAQARIYASPIVINANSRVVARARDLNRKQTGGPPSASSTPWSGPVAATLVVQPLPLVISEIMFHPAPPPAGSTFTADDFEFVEILNRGNTSVDLPGYQLSGGISFMFTATNAITRLEPDQRVLVVRNPAAFASRYPGPQPVAGAFTGVLRDSSDRILLIGPLQEPVLDLEYHDTWQPLADGFGFSLVLRNEGTPGSQVGTREAWKLSATPGGSPGLPDPVVPSLPSLYINEIVANPSANALDALELFNPNPSPVDLSGWWLTDDFRNPYKYRIPPQTLLDPGAHRVFTAADFGAAPSPFGFSRLGDEAFLFSADASGTLTGWFHGFRFGPHERGTSLARWVTSDGEEHLVPTWLPSLGQPNGMPTVPEAAISEILYFPPPSQVGTQLSDHAFIELTDLSFWDAPLALHDPDHPANTWRIRGSVAFDFPAGYRMPENRRVVVVGFDPLRAPDLLAGFRARFRLAPDVPILGPWQGGFSVAGGTVRLLKPLNPEPADPPNAPVVPYAAIAEVSFLPHAPWPADAVGTGRSIVTLLPGGFPDEPGNWISALPTPGDIDTDLDGLPDAWEFATGTNPYLATDDHGGEGDLDDDGYTNLEEYIAGTAANDGASLLTLTVATSADGATLISFLGGPSRTYTLLAAERPDAPRAEWQSVHTLTSSPEGGVLSLAVPHTPPTARFYRLRAE